MAQTVFLSSLPIFEIFYQVSKKKLHFVINSKPKLILGQLTTALADYVRIMFVCSESRIYLSCSAAFARSLF